MVIKYFDVKNAVLSFKAILTGILTSLVLIPFSVLARWLVGEKLMLGLGLIVVVVMFITYLFTWGFIARKFFSIE